MGVSWLWWRLCVAFATAFEERPVTSQCLVLVKANMKYERRRRSYAFNINPQRRHR